MQTIEKIIKSNIPPQRTNVLWMDISLEKSVLKGFKDGQWTPVSSEDADVQHLQEEINEIIEKLAGEGGTIQDLANVKQGAEDGTEALGKASELEEKVGSGSIYDTSILDAGEEQYAYGVLIDFTQGKSSYDITRIGNMDLHRELPVQSQYKGCIWDLKNQEIVTYLNPENWNLAYGDYTAEQIATLMADTTKSIRVETPKFYACSKVLATDGAGNTTMAKVMFSTQKLSPLYIEIPKIVTDFRDVRMNGDGYPTACLADDDIYGGYCTTKNSSSTGKSGLLHPITNIDRATMRNAANSCNTYLFCYEYYKWIFYWAFAIEYATLWSAKPMNNQLDENGFHQGGLGPGMTSIESRGAKYSDDSYIYNEDYAIQDNFYLSANYLKSNASDEFPLRDIGVTNNWGNRTGENIVEYTRDGKTSHVHQNRYRGFEFPFGDITMNLDGFLGYTFKDNNDVSIAEAYFTCSNPEKFQDTLPSEYDSNDFDNGWRLALWNDKLDNFNREGYDEGAAKAMCIGNNGDLFATKWFVGQGFKFDKYFVNYNYPLDGNQNTTLVVGSSAGGGGLSDVGLGDLNADNGVGSAGLGLGFRCFNIIQD